jgi:hypothetical protein
MSVMQDRFVQKHTCNLHQRPATTTAESLGFRRADALLPPAHLLCCCTGSIAERALKVRADQPRGRACRLELIIHTEADQVGVEFGRNIGTDDWCERRIRQIDEQIFDPCRPVVGEGAFDTGARSPAGLVGALPIGRRVDDDIAEGNATGEVK